MAACSRPENRRRSRAQKCHVSFLPFHDWEATVDLAGWSGRALTDQAATTVSIFNRTRSPSAQRTAGNIDDRVACAL